MLPRWLLRAASTLPSWVIAVLLVGCSPQDDGHDHADPAGPDAEAAMPSARVPIPPDVRRALGLSFARVERRAVAETLRVPGRFELLPTARQEVHATAAGRVELLKSTLDAVSAGEVIARIEAPVWRELQLELSAFDQRERSIRIEVQTIELALATHEQHHESLEARMALWKTRITELEIMLRENTGRTSDLNAARVALHEVEGDLAEHHEQVALQQGQKRALEEEARAIEERRTLRIAHMAALQGTTREDLLAPSGEPQSTQARWQVLGTLDLRAPRSGRIESVIATSGAWLETGAEVLSIVQPEELWFRAQAMESDLGTLQENARARIVPPRWDGMAPSEALDAVLHFGLRATSAQRAVELIFAPATEAAWARAGVHAFAEVIVRDAPYPELAIPNSCILRDEGRPIFFRRDSKDPDQVIREDADLGFDDGRWTEVLSGVVDGEEIVLDGAFQLLLATADTAPKGGHMHPDGSFHADDH